MAVCQSEESYRRLFEENPQPMLVCQAESGRLLAANDALLRLLGYRREELPELPLSRLMPEPEAAFGEKLPPFARFRRKDGGLLEAELIRRRCDFQGERAHLLLFREKAGEREELLERRIAEAGRQAEGAQRELETFSYSVSHDLQAPLRHIDGFSRALLDDYGQVLDGQAREYLSRISQASAKMSHLIEALQQLSRVARAELRRQPVNLSVAAQVALLELKRGAPQREVELSVEEGVTVEADPKLARQLIEILLGNAWKFTSRSERVRISFGSREVGGERALFVSDNGAGFDMAYAEKLFTIFHRLHRSDEFEGSGVGLAIAQRIVARHGGRIWAESAPGEGATFYFTLQ